LFFQGRREELFKGNPKYRKVYNFIQKSDSKLTPEQKQNVDFERNYLHNIIRKYIRILATIPEKGK